MQYSERQRDSEEAAEKAEGAGRLLLAMGLNRYFLNSKAALVFLFLFDIIYLHFK